MKGDQKIGSPATDAEFMELMSTGKPEGVLQHSVLVRSHQQFVGTHWRKSDLTFKSWSRENLKHIHFQNGPI